MGKQYKSGTIESILEDRLVDLLEHGTINRKQFVPLVMADIKQDLKCDPNIAPDLLDACKVVMLWAATDKVMRPYLWRCRDCNWTWKQKGPRKSCPHCGSKNITVSVWK